MPTVHLRISDAATNKPTPVRLRITDAAGRYHAPLGRLTEFATAENLEVGGNVLHDGKAYCHIDGACEVELPPGRITIEASKGFEYRPVRQEIDLKPGQLAIRLALERWIDLRADGWYSGDVRSHYLAPHAALLEAVAEDLAVVQLLACTWHDEHGTPALPNLLAFSGQSAALERPGHAVAVNTLNRSPLGSLSLLHCHRIVFPLHVDQINWTLADWCDQCHRKRGLVIWPEAIGATENDRESEALASLILSKVDAVETSDLSWCGEDTSAYYDLLNCGIRVPLTGASGKSSNTTFLGDVRTFAQLAPGEACTSKTWIEAVRAGRTFISDGPVLTFTANEHGPGATIDVMAPEARLQVHAEVRSLSAVEKLQIVRNGEVVIETGGRAINIELPAHGTGWWVARCWGRDPATRAHTSPIYVQTASKPMAKSDTAVEKVRQRLQRLEARVNKLSAEGRFASVKDAQRVRAILQEATERL